LAAYRDAIGLILVVLGITLATHILGEQVPRRIALHRPEPIARLVARPIRALAIVANPLVRSLGTATDRVLRTLGARSAPASPATEEGLQARRQEGSRAGVLDETEVDSATRVLRSGARRARGLMTPRNDIIWIALAVPP